MGEKPAQQPGEDVSLTITGKSATVTVDGGVSGTDGQASAEKKEDPLGATVWKAAGAVLTAIGATGAVVVVGATVLWVRFNELGLPATQAVSVQPKFEPLVLGAQSTILFALIALTAVLLIFFFDQKGEVNWLTLAVLLLLAGVAILYAWLTQLPGGAKWGLTVLALLLLLGCIAIGRRTPGLFWPLALTVFTVALVFSAGCGLLIVHQEKFGQAVAILRGGSDEGLTGIYVTTNNEKVYYGQNETIGTAGGTATTGGLYEVKLGDETTYAVGPLQDQEDAARSANALLAGLIEARERSGGSPAAGGGTTKAAAGSGSGGSAAGGGSEVAATGEGPGPAPPTTPGSKLFRTFTGPVSVHREVEGSSICLVRFTELGAGKAVGPWWTSCREAEGFKTMAEAKEALALPGRFQAVYDMRIELEVSGGAPLVYAEGRAEKQCEHLLAYCGHSYEGGGTQYFLFDPAVAFANAKTKAKIACTSSRPDEPADWGSCGQ